MSVRAIRAAVAVGVLAVSVGAGCSVESTELAVQAVGACRQVDLLAHHKQPAQQDLAPPMRFVLPSNVLVLQHNAGQHEVIFKFRTGSTLVQCRYDGGNKSAKDKPDFPYPFVSCTDGSSPGNVVESDHVELSFEDGGLTDAKVSLHEELPCGLGEQPFETRASIFARVVDGNGQPLTNVTFQVLDLPSTGQARSDVTVANDQGSFRIRLSQFPETEAPGPAHHELLTIQAAGKLRAYRDVYLRARDAVDLGVITLAASDPTVTTIGSAGGTATDSQNRISIVIPAGALTQNTPIRITAFTTRDEVSYPLPDTTATTYGFVLEPDGQQFAQPVTVKLANWRGLPTNMDIPVGTFDAANGRWSHMAEATWNGQAFTFTTTHFSVFDANWGTLGDWILRLLSGSSPNNSASTCAGSSIGLANGTLRQIVPLPSYLHRDERLGITLNYDSGLAGSRILHPPSQQGPSIGALATISGMGIQAMCVARGSGGGGGGGSSPGTCSAGSCQLGGTAAPSIASTSYIMGHQTDGTFALAKGQNEMELGSWVSLPQDQQGQTTVGPSWVQQHIVASLPGTTSACISGGGTFGVANVGTAPVEANIGQGPVLNLTHRTFMHHRHNSPFGAGWAMSGIDRLYPDPFGDRAVLVRGDGSDEEFGPHIDITIGGRCNCSQKARAFAHEYQGDNYILTEDGNTLAKLGADMNTGAIVFANLPLASQPEDLAVASVGGKRHFVAALKKALIDIDDQGNVKTLAARDGDTIEATGGFSSVPDVYLQAHVAASGSLVYYTEGDPKKPLLYRLDLADQSPTLAPMTTLTGHVELDPTNQPASAVQFSVVNGLAFDQKNNRLFAADRMRNVIMAFLPDPNANNTVTANSKLARVMGDGSATILPQTGERFTGTKISMNQPAFLSVWDNGDLFVASLFGVGLWNAQTEDFEWLVTGVEDPTSSLTFGIADSPQDVSSLVALGPSSFAFVSGRQATIGMTVNGLESRYEPTRTLSLANGIWTLTDATAATVDAFESAPSTPPTDGRMLEHRHRTGEPIFSVQYVGQSTNVDTITDPEGGKTSFTYSNGILQTITDPQNRTTQFSIDSKRDLRSITDPNGDVESFDYDVHHMTQKTSPRGDVSVYEYTSDGTLKKSTKPTGEVSTFTPALSNEPVINNKGRVERHGQYTDSRGVTHDVIVDRRGQLTADTYVADNVTYALTASYGFERAGNPQLGEVDTFDLNNNQTDFFKQRRNSILRIAFHTLNGVQLGLWRNFDEFGRIVDVREQGTSGIPRWLVKYDASGWISTINEDNATQLERRIERDNAGHVTRDVDGIPNTNNVTTRETKYTYRSDGQPETITDHGVVYTLSYDDQGGTKNLLSITDTLNRSQTLGYDIYGNPKSVTDGVATSTFVYDVMNRLVSATDGANNTTTYGYKVMNCGCTDGDRITSIHTPDLGQNQQWTLDYGPEGRVSKVTDPDGNARSIGYTVPGDVNLSTDPLNHSSSWTYDSLGRVTTMTDPLGRAHAHAHPTPDTGKWTGVRVMAGSSDNTAPPTALNAALTNGQYQVGLGSFQNFGDPPRLEYYRDATFERGIAMAWDEQRRLSTRADQPNVAVSQIDPTSPNFPIAGMREQFSYFHGRAAPVAQFVTSSGQNYNENDTFSVDAYFDTTDAQGWAQAFPWVDDVITRDSAGRVTKVDHNFKSVNSIEGAFGTSFAGIPSQYTYANNGYVTNVTNADGDHTLAYDARGLLSSITVKGEDTQLQVVYGFKYDSVGRNSEIDFPDGHTRTQKYDSEGRISERCYNYTINNQPVARCYTAKYDAAGNPTTLTDPDGTDVIQYDALNRLMKLTRTDNNQQTTVEDYGYNAIGALNKNAGTQLDDQRTKLSGNGTADAAVPANFQNQPVTLDGSGRITKFKGATLKYNLRGRLTRVDKPIQNGTETEVYGHDSAMRRIYRTRFTTINNQKTVEEEEYYVYEGPNLVGVLDKNGSIQLSYLYAGVDQPIRVKQFGFISTFIEMDLAGNVRHLTGYGGDDRGSYRYTAFGIPDPNLQAPQLNQPLRWKGRPWSDFSSLYDVRARQWSPEMGVFTAIDEYRDFDHRTPLWGWPNQNPARYADETGRCGPACVLVIVGGFLVADALLPSDQPHQVTNQEAAAAVAGLTLVGAGVFGPGVLTAVGARFPTVGRLLGVGAGAAGGGAADKCSRAGSSGALDPEISATEIKAAELIKSMNAIDKAAGVSPNTSGVLTQFFKANEAGGNVQITPGVTRDALEIYRAVAQEAIETYSNPANPKPSAIAEQQARIDLIDRALRIIE